VLWVQLIVDSDENDAHAGLSALTLLLARKVDFGQAEKVFDHLGMTPVQKYSMLLTFVLGQSAHHRL
jgi:hypothetical protein